MKQLLTLVLLFMLVQIGFSQENTSIVDTEKIWSNIFYTWGHGVDRRITISYKIEGDTTIENNTYFKIFSCEDSILESWSFTSKYIREKEKKVYIKESNNEEKLLYDFNLQVGDSIKMGLQGDIWFYLKKVDSILIDEIKRKRMTFSWHGNSDETWIETIGSLSNFIRPGYMRDFPNFLSCVKDKETKNVIYKNPIAPTCFEIKCTKDGINCNTSSEILKLTYSTEIYPNPTTDILNIRTKIDSYIFRISDLNGRIVLEDKYSGNVKLNLVWLKEGIYIGELISKNNSITFRILKNNFR